MSARQPQQRATRVLPVTEAEITRKQVKHRRFDMTLGVLGKLLISTGLLMLLFMAYQLWGTGLSEQRAQSDLQRQFTSQLPGLPEYGYPVTRLQIDAIDVDKIVVAGVDYQALQKGPGLFDGSPLPGQVGNVAIAGHRTSFGAPFARINELKVGDDIVLTRDGVTHTYVVKTEPFIVQPSDISVVKTRDLASAELTLVSCHPKWTSKNRIIVKADLKSTIEPLPATVYEPTKVDVVPALTPGWFHDSSAIPGALAFAIVLTLIAFIARRSVRRGRAVWVVYPVTALVFLPVLFIFFGYLTRLMPANL